MDYKCFICEKEFENIDSVFKHLKNDEKLRNKETNLECVINFPSKGKCKKYYQTYDGLRKHLRTCIKTRKTVSSLFEFYSFFRFCFIKKINFKSQIGVI